MERFVRRLAALAVALGIFGCAHLSGDSRWTTLVDGDKGLENFDRLGDANWRAEGGAIVADQAKDTSYLVTRTSYRDFQVRAEFWADHTTNSGIFIRIQDPKKVGSANSYEVNIYDRRPDPSYGTGAIVDFAKVSPMPTAGGKWNTFVITAKGSNLKVELNGVQTVNIDNDKFPSGPFALQFGNGPNNAPGGAIKWRKVQVRPL